MASRIPVLNSPQVTDSVRKKLHVKEEKVDTEESSQPAGRMRLRSRKVLSEGSKTTSRRKVRSETVTKHIGKPTTGAAVKTSPESTSTITSSPQPVATESKAPANKKVVSPLTEPAVKTKSPAEVSSPAPNVVKKKSATVTKKVKKGRIPSLSKGFGPTGMSPTLIHHDPPSTTKPKDKHSKIPSMRPSFLSDATSRVFRESNPNSPSQSPQRTPKRLSVLQMPFDKENTPPPKSLVQLPYDIENPPTPKSLVHLLYDVDKTPPPRTLNVNTPPPQTGSDAESPGLHSTKERRPRGTNRSNLPRRATARRGPKGAKATPSGLTSSSSGSSSVSTSASEVESEASGDVRQGRNHGPVMNATFSVENEGASVFRDSILSCTGSESSRRDSVGDDTTRDGAVKDQGVYGRAIGARLVNSSVISTARDNYTCSTVQNLKDAFSDNTAATRDFVCMQVQGENRSEQNPKPPNSKIPTSQPLSVVTKVPQPTKEAKKKPPPSSGIKNKISFFTPSSIYSNAPMHSPELPAAEMFPSITCYRVSVIEPQNTTPTSGLTTLKAPVSRYQSRVTPQPDVIGAVHPVNDHLAGAAAGPVYLCTRTDTTTVYHTPTVWPTARPLSLHRSHPAILPPNHPSVLPSVHHQPASVFNPVQSSYPPESNLIPPPYPTRIITSNPVLDPAHITSNPTPYPTHIITSNPAPCSCTQPTYRGPMPPAPSSVPLLTVPLSHAPVPALHTSHNLALTALQDAAADREVARLTQSLTSAASREGRDVVNPVASRLDGDFAQQYTFQPIHIPTRTVLQNQGSAFRRILIC